MRPLVLIVDDDDAIADSLREVLEMEGLEPITAHDGSEGLVTFQRHRPDLVVADLMMPVLDGPAMVRAIRASEGSTVPVILMSAAHGLPGRAELPAHDAFLEKPFQVDVFLHEVKRLLRSRGA